MNHEIQTANIDFHTYPTVGQNDWRYAFHTAQVRVLDSQMLTKATLTDMANAENFQDASDLLGSTEYTMPQSSKSFEEAQKVLLLQRSSVRKLFADLMIDKKIVELFKSRIDFANMQLALRRRLTDKPIGDGYCDQGNVDIETLEEVFESEDYHLFPYHMQEAAEMAVLAYYPAKDIRQIDHALDAAQAWYNSNTAAELKSPFLKGLFATQVDLTNIRTMLRLKFTESPLRDVFLKGGYVDTDILNKGIDSGYETLGQLFFATPYDKVIEAGAGYLAVEKSFLKIEHHCDEHLMGFLKTASQITAGPQPVIAYLLAKEDEIRKVRLILTAKKNALDTKLILTRLGL